jgi:hypothetical protein
MEFDNIEAIVTLAGKLKEVKTDLEGKISAIPYIKGERGDDGRDGVDGKDGKDGRDGKDGKNGRDGLDGKGGQDGRDGVDGVSVVDASVDFDGHLVIKLSDGNEIDVGKITASDEGRVVHISQSGGGSITEFTYSSSDPTEFAVGGLPIGSTFDKVKLSDMFTLMFYGTLDDKFITVDGENFLTSAGEQLVVEKTE